MAVAGPRSSTMPMRPCSWSASSSAWPRCGAGRCASTRPPDRLRRLLPARVAALLLRVPARPARLRGWLDALHPAQGRGPLVLSGRLARLRPLDQPALLDGTDARRGARARAVGGPGLEVVDVGAGTGFATEAIVRTVAPERVTMLDQSPHQLAPGARRKRALAGVAKVIGDAEACPSRPTRATATSRPVHRVLARSPARHRGGLSVLRPGGVALLAGRVAPTQPLARALSDAWMLSPARTSTSRGRAGGLRVDRARVRRARLVGPPLGPLRRGDRGRQAGRASRRRCRRRRRATNSTRPPCRCAWRASPQARSPARPSSPSRCGSRSCASCAGDLRPRRRAGAERAGEADAYPWSLPVVRGLERLKLDPGVTFLVGENGSGKSTLIEALAVCLGLNPEGGTQNFAFATRESHSPLHEALRPVRRSAPAAHRLLPARRQPLHGRHRDRAARRGGSHPAAAVLWRALAARALARRVVPRPGQQPLLAATGSTSSTSPRPHSRPTACSP